MLRWWMLGRPALQGALPVLSEDLGIQQHVVTLLADYAALWGPCPFELLPMYTTRRHQHAA
jgi:hypothetical protein